jgi:hypothetical protein
VKKEWNDNVQRKEEELEEEKKQMLLNISVQFKNYKLTVSNEESEDSGFLERNNIEVIIND